MLKRPRDAETLRKIAILLPGRSGSSYDSEQLHRRSKRRIQQVENAFAEFADGSPDLALELGCGRGENGPYLLGAGVGNYLGLDIDGSKFSLSDREELGYLVGSADSIPLDDASVDLVVSFNVFEHLPSPQQAFSEAARVLRPGGLFMTTFGPPFNCASGPHLTRYIDLPFMHHLFSERAVAEFVGRDDAYHTVNQFPLEHYRQLFLHQKDLELCRYHETVTGAGFWLLQQKLPELCSLPLDEYCVAAITVVARKS